LATFSSQASKRDAASFDSQSSQILSNGNNNIVKRPTHLIVSTHEFSYDLPSLFKSILSTIQGVYPRLRSGSKAPRAGDSFYVEDKLEGHSEDDESILVPGGSLFSYEISKISSSNRDNGVDLDVETVDKGFDLSHVNNDNVQGRKLDWKKKVLFRGFKVRGWIGFPIFNPGAPGFPYVIHMPNKNQVYLWLTIF
jgi:hypothetical protein